jgi:hypothetical protein
MPYLLINKPHRYLHVSSPVYVIVVELKNLSNIQVSRLLDCSLPAAVSQSFMVVVGFAACGGKAYNHHKTLARRRVVLYIHTYS